MLYRVRPVGVIPALLMLCGSALAEQDATASIQPRLRFSPSRAGSASAASATFRVDANLVLVPVNVVDAWDRQVLGLAKEQFRLFDGQVEQSITHFVSEDAPISIAIVFDASGSMGPKLRRSRDAVADILTNANPEDEFALIQFHSRVERLVGLTDRAGEILNRLTFVRSRGQTALLDAIYYAVNTMKRARHARKAIILISDGGDNCSRYNILETRRMVREADVQIFAIGIFDPILQRIQTREEIDGPELLRAVADDTGGRFYFAEGVDEMRDVAARIGKALRHEYLLGYSPSAVAKDGKYHTITVQVDGASRLRVFRRLGYYAPGTW